jgi:acetyl-CoA carboxylase carboxyltransferase component
VRVSRSELGGSAVHAQRTGVASLVVPDDLAARDALAALLWYLPDHHLDDPARLESDDPSDRDCDIAATAVPRRSSASYDVRTVVKDVLDRESFLEVRPRFAPNLVTGYGSLGGRAVGVVANQPMTRAGTLDIEASRKAARFVTACDAFNLPIVTFVDTPGFEPGRDLEWRGMIRHGAELVHAYSAATVPRLCVVLRKAYGGAYIVMDSRGIGNDLCVAWPNAEIAVMGAAGAVAILNKGRTNPELVAEYQESFENPYRAAERGFVDAVIEPAATRRVLVDALGMLAQKRGSQPARKHSNTPL